MSKIFYDFKGRECDILHSEDFCSKKFIERKAMAFDKASYQNLSERDKLLLNGYAFSIKEREAAERYNFKKLNPNYKRKTK